MQLSDKLDELNKWVKQVFEATAIEDSLNNARKSGEALCKVVILHHYGETQGNKIILNQEDINGNPVDKPRLLEFFKLMEIVGHEKDKNHIIVEPKGTRYKIRAYLDSVRSHANPASHDSNNPSDISNERDAEFTKDALINLVIWLYKDFLFQPFPPEILPYIKEGLSSYTDADNETVSYEDVRGSDIVKICYPKQKVTVQVKHNDSRKRIISYEFITVEVTNTVLIGYVFVKKNIVINKTLQHFIENLNLELTSLIICSPRVIKKDGQEITDRINNIREKFHDLVDKNDLADKKLLSTTEYYFIDDFVWERCLGEYARGLELNLENEHYFVDQELFQIQDGKQVRLQQPSLQYIKQIISSPERKKPVNIIVGRAGVGKTTFCEQLVTLVNSCDKKRALLISSTDLRNASTDFSVESLTDLYKLSVKINEIDSTEILEGNNFEINISCGNIVLIIDGLDEIESTLKEKFNFDLFLKSAIYLNEAYRSCSIIITSRDYYLDRYTQEDSVNVFTLLGFSNELVEQYLNKRLSKQKVRDAQKYLSSFDIYDQNHLIPLYLSLICDLVDREEYQENAMPDIQESKYYYLQSRLDNLIYKLLQREIGKQSLNVTCDDYFDLIVEISVINQGLITKNGLNEYIGIFLSSIEVTSSNEADKYTQFYISPLLSYERNTDTFKVKYDFVESWAKIRFFLYNFEKNPDNKDLQRLLIELYDGSSVLLEELVEMKSIATKIDYIERGSCILKILIGNCKQPENNNKLSLTRKAISGLLYFVLSGTKKSRTDYSNDLVQLFGCNKLNHLCIFGQFFPLDFTEIQVYEGWFEQYQDFEKCKFPSDKTVFYYSTFKGIDPEFSRSFNSLLFDSTCNLNEELRKAFDDSLKSAGNVSNQVQANLCKILKVGYRSGSFSWKSENVYRKAQVKGHISLDKYLKFLTWEGVLEKRSEEAGSNDGFIVSKNFKDSAKNLIANNIVKPELERVIKKILSDFCKL